MYNNFQELRKEARFVIIDALNDEYEGCLCDFHSEVFNMEPYTENIYTAKEKLNEWGVWEAIEKVQSYEKDNFGELYTELSNPVKVINMLWYVIGEEEMYSMFDGCAEFDELWNEEITENDTHMLMAWAKDNERI